MSLDLALVQNHVVATPHLEMLPYHGKKRFKLTIFFAVICFQPPDPLQPDILTGGRVNIIKDAFMQPGIRGTEVEERRKRTADSPFLSKYSGEKRK